jgi:hypothetical protein
LFIWFCTIYSILLKIWTEWVINCIILSHFSIPNHAVGAGAGAASRYGSGSDQKMRLRLRNTALEAPAQVLMLTEIYLKNNVSILYLFYSKAKEKKLVQHSFGTFLIYFILNRCRNATPNTTGSIFSAWISVLYILRMYYNPSLWCTSKIFVVM